MFNNWPNNLLGINKYKTLESCQKLLLAILKWSNTTYVISKRGTILSFSSLIIF